MYLANSVRDFEALIETINVEVAWEDKVKLVLFIFIFPFFSQSQ